MGNKIYNIPAKESFVDVLAEHFLQEYADNPQELANVLILLPNRRACQAMSEAFVRFRAMTPTILPRILPVADVEEDEVFLSGHSEILSGLEPEIDKTERVFIFTRLILQKPKDWGLGSISLSQAYNLAENLALLIDTAYNENLDFSRIAEIVPSEYAIHWQETLKLLAIITQYWPQILRERGVVDSSYRRCRLLEAELELWQKIQPQQRIVVAGTTSAFPILKKLVEVVSKLPNGEVYLYGVDKYLEDSAWEEIDENHPQFELKELLDYLQIKRENIVDIKQSSFSPRGCLVSEIMRPAMSSAKWRSLTKQKIADEAFAGIQLVNCDDLRQEARAISLIMRKTLETPEKTVALVTSDRNLSRRVIAELKKWDIKADDSAGQPLSLTPIGIYLRLIINVLEQNFSQVSFLALMKHPFTAVGKNYATFNQAIHKWEVCVRKKQDVSQELQEIIDNVRVIIHPLEEMYQNPQVDFKEMLMTHIQVAERLADTESKTGEKIIWRGDGGACCAKFICSILSKADILQTIPTNEYGNFLTSMMFAQNVRSRFGMHPRVKILGPIEARLSQYDVTIIGEANEGVWPKQPSADLWMSRPMKREFGFPLPERTIGVMSADFAHLMMSPEVYITRAERVGKSPTNKSRWWLRFETVISANFGDAKEKIASLYDRKYSLWAKYLERAEVLCPIKSPQPRPSVDKRPRKLSASSIEMLMRDPYTVFAKHILKLYPLDELDEDLMARDYGNIVHKVIEEFNNKYNHDYPPDAKEQLLNMGEEKFLQAQIPEDVKAFWWPRFAKTIDWLTSYEQEYRPTVATIHNEIEGEMKFNTPNGEFTITAKADRIDETKVGRANIIDYKTGKARSVKEVIAGWAPQLPIEGLILQSGGYKEIVTNKVLSLRYLQLDGKENLCNETESEKAMSKVKNYIEQLISQFDFASTAYLAKPNPRKAPAYSDYDHLSRYLEWSVKDDEND